MSLEMVKSLDALVAKRTLDIHIFGIESFQLRFRFSDDRRGNGVPGASGPLLHCCDSTHLEYGLNLCSVI